MPFLFLPSLFIGLATPIFSRTTNIENYLDLDDLVDTDDFFHELFPQIITFHLSQGESRELDLNPSYFYQCQAYMTETCDVYAEWALPLFGFWNEVSEMEQYNPTIYRFHGNNKLLDKAT